MNGDHSSGLFYLQNLKTVAMIESKLFWFVPAASVLALFFAWYFFRNMMKTSEGTDKMKKIASHVRKGAMA